MRRLFHWIAALLFSMSAYAHETGEEIADIVLLEVFINDRPTERVVPFTRHRDGLFATAGNLRSLGIGVQGDDEILLPLSEIANHFRIDQAALKIDIDLPMRFLTTTDIATMPPTTDAIPLADDTRGALLNYDLLATDSVGHNNLGGYFDVRFFSGSKVFSSTALAYVDNNPASSVRLDTTLSNSNPRQLTRYRFGDFITSGLFWTRPVRFGGAQFGIDFSLRPDLIRFPTPSLGGEAVVPSTVDLFVNGVHQLSQTVPPGPFEIRQAPIATGAGQVALAVTDEVGRQTYRTVSFYASDKLLKEDLSSYTLESGWIRRNYGLRSLQYGKFAIAATARRGFSERLTWETHAEAMQGMLLAGAGLVFNINDWGVLSGALSTVSSADGNDRQYALGIERTSSVLSISAAHIHAGPRYRDMGAMEGSPVARSTTIGAMGLNLGDYGSLSLAYASATSPVLLSSSGNIALRDSKSVTLSYFKSLSRSANLYVTGFRDFRNGGYGATVGLIMPFGDHSTGGASVGSSNGMRTASLQASRSTVSPGDVGWHVQTTQGAYRQRYAEVDYKTGRGLATYAVAQNNDVTSQRAGMRGALVWMDNATFLSNWIEDSFAVVTTEGSKDIGVYTENRYAGRTDENGRLLLSDLRAYDANKISIEVLDLPLTRQTERSEQYVKPIDRAGALVNFTTKRISEVSLTLKLRNGQYVPVGSTVNIRENGQVAPVGYEGMTYLSELGSANILDVNMPSGETCQATLTPTSNPNGSRRSIILECH